MKLLLLIIPLLVFFIIPAYAETEFCGKGYYIMHDKCYELPPLVPQLNDDLGIYTPMITDQFGKEIEQGAINQRTYITSVIKNNGDVPHEFKISIKYMKAEKAEWSKEKYAKSVVNPGQTSTVIMPFLLAQDIHDMQVNVQLNDKDGIVHTYKMASKITMESEIKKPVYPFPLDSDSNNLIPNSVIPSWVKSIFAYYGEGKLTDIELLEAIKFLVSNNILIL